MKFSFVKLSITNSFHFEILSVINHQKISSNGENKIQKLSYRETRAIEKLKRNHRMHPWNREIPKP
jgi:ribosomal protein L13